jgi:DNA primase
MSPVSDAVIEQVRLASDIVEVVQAYAPLKRAGSTFRALCPFHQEKTPSFHVNPQRQFFHCFGCGAGGDVFKFVMAMEKTDFMTALRLLAKRAGISLAQDPAEAGREAAKDRLFEINQHAAAFFHDLLMKAPEADAARAYLKSRDLTSQTAREFLIGFAPDRWDALVRWGGTRYPPDQLAAAGLVVIPSEERRAGGGAAAPYDRFRNRIMFPILDEMGRVAGFSGRLLADDPGAAKYVNTPETAVFHKSRLLYGLHRARRALADRREAILCEGQIDVIRCQLAGFTAAVAAQGTAFTPDHARVLKRYADSVVLVFDADAAGQKAALRALEVLLQAELAARVAVMPGDDDPDSLIRREGPEAFQRLLDNALSGVDFHVHHLAGREDLGTELGLMRAAAEVADLISRAPNPVQQTVLLRQAAERLRLPESALQRELDKRKPLARPEARPSAPPPSTAAPAAKPIRELALAEHLLADPALAEWVRTYLPLDLITDPDCRALVGSAIRAWEQGKDIFAVLAEADSDHSELGEFAARLMAAPVKTRGALASQEDSVRDLILSIRSAALEEQRGRVRRDLAAAEAAGPEGAATAKRLRAELIEIGYDLAKLKKWETALPLITPQA